MDIMIPCHVQTCKAHLILDTHCKPSTQPTQDQEKRAGGVAQVVKHLPSKGEALSSNPNTIKKKNQGKKTEAQFIIYCIQIGLGAEKLVSARHGGTCL
jgi:hypothetical protein